MIFVRGSDASSPVKIVAARLSVSTLTRWRQRLELHLKGSADNYILDDAGVVARRPIGDGKLGVLGLRRGRDLVGRARIPFHPFA